MRRKVTGSFGRGGSALAAPRLCAPLFGGRRLPTSHLGHRDGGNRLPPRSPPPPAADGAAAASASPSGCAHPAASAHHAAAPVLGVPGGRQDPHPPPQHGNTRPPALRSWGHGGRRETLPALGTDRGTRGRLPRHLGAGHRGRRTGAGSATSPRGSGRVDPVPNRGGDAVTGAGGFGQALSSTAAGERGRVNATRFGVKKGGFPATATRGRAGGSKARSAAAQSDGGGRRSGAGTGPGPSQRRAGSHFGDRSSPHNILAAAFDYDKRQTSH